MQQGGHGQSPNWNRRHDNHGGRVLSPISLLSDPESSSAPSTSQGQNTQDSRMLDVAFPNERVEMMPPPSLQANTVLPPAGTFVEQSQALTPPSRLVFSEGVSQPSDTPQSQGSASGSDTATFKCGVGLNPEDKNRQAEEDELKRELCVIEVMFGKHNIQYLTKTILIAEILLDQARLTPAGDMLLSAISDYKTNNTTDVHLFKAFDLLGQILHAQGFHSRAEEARMQAVEAAKHVYGPEHQKTLMSIIDLASTYNHLGRLKEAETLELQMMEKCDRLLGKSHPATLTCCYNLSHTYGLQKRFKETEDLLVHVVAARIELLGSEKPEALQASTRYLATCLAHELVKVYSQARD
jgi:hypothetical protein